MQEIQISTISDVDYKFTIRLSTVGYRLKSQQKSYQLYVIKRDEKRIFIFSVLHKN